MSFDLPVAGAASPELAAKTVKVWMEEATKAGIDLTGFDPNTSLPERIAWARSMGLLIAGILSRFSSKMQHSTESQVLDCMKFAAWHGMFVPSEFISVDEATSGRKVRRAGLNRMKMILQEKLVNVLLVFKVSRLFRNAYRGYQLFLEDVVEEGMRGISISQGIDTDDDKVWKPLMCLHGLMDELLLEAIADHVRSGLKSLFLTGFVTGALTVGYEPVEVPGAPPTNQGKPRRMPRVVAEVAAMIVQHYEWIRDGMSIREGWRRWVDAGGPCDPRSTLGHMACDAYRRMLSNPRFIGRWAFGRKRNSWSSKRDYTRQVLQPDTEVTVRQCEELRIVTDELFFAVQARLEKFKLGERGPKKKKDLQLWDLVIDCFFCAECKVRYWQAGSNGHSMQCKRRDLCPCSCIVRRKEAVLAVCQKLSELIRRDGDLIVKIIARAEQIDAAGDEAVAADLARVETKLAGLSRKLEDLRELAGEGTDEDRANHKAKIRSVQAERAALQVERVRLQGARDSARASILPEHVQQILADLSQLLLDGAEGKLGQDVVYRAAAVFRQLVGDRIDVHVERRAGRKHTIVRGTFVPNLIRAAQTEIEDHRIMDCPESGSVEVFLRKIPKRDLLAPRVHELVDVQGLSLRAAAAVLQKEGHPKTNSAIVWQYHRRYHEMLGQPAPDLNGRHPNGRPKHPNDPAE